MTLQSKIRWFILAPLLFSTVLAGLWTQVYLGTMPIPECGILDRIFEWTAAINEFFHQNPKAANFVLATTSFWYDFCILFIMARSIYKRSIHPYFSIVLFFLCRQSMQLLVSLPIPEGLIWHDPGFPTLFIFYGISNDLYFSAHTGVSLLAAIELYRIGKPWTKALGIASFTYMILGVILLRFHYTMDVYTAVLTVFLTTYLSRKWGPSVEGYLKRIGPGK